MVTQLSWEEKNFMQPMERPKHCTQGAFLFSLVPNVFPLLFPSSSQWVLVRFSVRSPVPNGFLSGSQYVPFKFPMGSCQVLNMFPSSSQWVFIGFSICSPSSQWVFVRFSICTPSSQWVFVQFSICSPSSQCVPQQHVLHSTSTFTPYALANVVLLSPI